MTNDDVLLHMHQPQPSVLNHIRSRKMRYFGHIVREGGILYNIIMGKTEGKRARGRQRTGWMDDIMRWSSVSGGVSSLVECARDRLAWRSMVANPQNSEDGTWID